jgi:hypothetical protein
VLSWHIKSVGLLPREVHSFLRSVKEDLGLKTLGIYSIPCECGQVYIGQTSGLIDTRLKEHHQHICREHPDKSAMAEKSINLRHRIHLHHTTILSTKPRYMEHINRETTEIELHPNNINREDGFCLSKSWKPLICSLKDRRKPPSQDCRSGFSAGPHRSMRTALIRAQTLPSPALSLHCDVPASLRYLHCMTMTHTRLLSHTPQFPCPLHPYTSPHLPSTSTTGPFKGHAGYRVLVSYWFAWLCVTANGNG